MVVEGLPARSTYGGVWALAGGRETEPPCRRRPWARRGFAGRPSGSGVAGSGEGGAGLGRRRGFPPKDGSAAWCKCVCEIGRAHV